MWQALVRSGVPASIVPDWLLERKAHEPGNQLGFSVLLAPAKGSLEPNTELALQAFTDAGVAVIRAEPEQDWEDPISREMLGQSMLAKALAATEQQPRVSLPLPSPRSSGAAAHDQPLHVIAYDLTTAAAGPTGGGTAPLMIHILNNFSWCSPSAAIKVPPPAPTPVEAGTVVLVRDVRGNATARVVLTGDTVAMARNGSQLELTLPGFNQSIVVRVDFM